MIDKEGAYANLVAALKQDAEEHIANKTIVLPVDIEAFAYRLFKASSGPIGKVIGMLTGANLLKREDYVRAVCEVCKELKLKTK